MSSDDGALDSRVRAAEVAGVRALDAAILCHNQVADLTTTIDILKKLIGELQAVALAQQSTIETLETQIARLRGPLH